MNDPAVIAGEVEEHRPGCSIKPADEEQCVYLSYEGDLAPRELAAARHEACALLGRRRWIRMVMDLTRLRSVLTGIQVFDFATRLAAQFPRDVRLALVVRPDQVQDAILVEKIAQTDGVLLAYFPDPKKAALWIRQTNGQCAPNARQPA